MALLSIRVQAWVQVRIALMEHAVVYDSLYSGTTDREAA